MQDIKIPQHVAIVMDGNGRWAKEHNMPRNEGHRRGTKTLEEIIKYADQLGIRYLTVYAFSTENWKRPKEEVEGLMKLFRRYLEDNIKKSNKDRIRFKAIGDINSEFIPQDIQEKIHVLEEMTKDKSGICFNMAFNYGGRDELVRACSQVIDEVIKGTLKKEDLTEEVFENYLDTQGQPDPDLMIRTSGEMRTSNFLPWQLTYSEFYFASCLWPDFTKKEFDKALEAYSGRQRRFGESE